MQSVEKTWYDRVEQDELVGELPAEEIVTKKKSSPLRPIGS